MLCTFTFYSFGQEAEAFLQYIEEKETRVTFINPGIEFEWPIAFTSTINFQAGVGYGGSYPELTTGFKSGVQALIFPYLDGQYRIFIIEKTGHKKAN